MNGTNAASVGAVGPFNPGPSWQIKGTGDFNGDGKSDILWQNTTAQPAIWLMNGTNATFGGAAGSFNPGPSWHIKGTGDFNGDGKSDILWQSDDGTPAIWLMNGTNAASSVPSARQSGAELADQGHRRLQRRRQVRHPVAEHRRHAGDLADERHQRRVGRCRRLVQSGAELADQGHRRLQRRRQVRHPVAGNDGTPAIWLMNGTHAVSVGAAGSFNPGLDWHVIV